MLTFRDAVKPSDVEQLFEQLLEFIHRMSQEELRAAREGFDEEDMAATSSQADRANLLSNLKSSEKS
jgi:hypothetical protein